MTAARVLLLRHGRTEWNAQERFQGQEDVALDPVGLAQAARAARRVRKLRPTAGVSSDLARAWQTADAVAAATGLTVTKDARLRETYFSVWQGHTRAEIERDWPGEHAAWRAGGDVRPGGDGELRQEVGARMAEAVQEAAAGVRSGGLLVVVSHGGAIASGLQTLLAVPRASWPVVSGLSNCHWSVLRRRSAGWVLEEHNAHSLPDDVVGDET